MDQQVKVDRIVHSYYKKKLCSLFAVVNMDGYKTDGILSQTLDLPEETEDNLPFIFQSSYLYQFNEDNHKCILHATVLSKKLPPLQN